MKVEFYLGTSEEKARIGGFKVIGTLARVIGDFDDELGFLNVRIFIKEGKPSSALTASVASLAINRIFEEDPELVVKAMKITCDTEVPEWA